jgi:hypothetical protein
MAYAGQKVRLIEGILLSEGYTMKDDLELHCWHELGLPLYFQVEALRKDLVQSLKTPGLVVVVNSFMNNINRVGVLSPFPLWLFNEAKHRQSIRMIALYLLFGRPYVTNSAAEQADPRIPAVIAGLMNRTIAFPSDMPLIRGVDAWLYAHPQKVSVSPV